MQNGKVSTIRFNEWVCVCAQYEKAVARIGRQVYQAYSRGLVSDYAYRGYSQTEFGNGRTEFDIELKYHEGQPVIRSISRVSKPGRRVYSSVETMPRVADGLGVTIVSTPRGVMADHVAREQNVGGEVLCKVF